MAKKKKVSRPKPTRVSRTVRAEQQRRSKAAQKGWHTRRARERAEAMAKVARKAAREAAKAARMRSERALRGWQTRRLAEASRVVQREAREEVQEAAEAEEALPARPTQAERSELELAYDKIAELEERLQQLTAEREAAAVRDETYAERLDRFLKEGKNPDDHYAEVQAIAAHYGLSNREVYSELSGSPVGVGSAA